MRTHRLRWQLAAAQALLALGLVIGGTVVLASRTDDLRRAEAALGAQRDAEVVAAQVGPRLAEDRPLGEALLGSATRQIELTDGDGEHVGGALLSSDPRIAGAVLDALDRIGSTSGGDGIQVGNQVLGIEPVVDEDELRGVVVVAEPAPVRRGWRQLYGLDGGAAALLALLAAAMGWWIAGRITTPLARLTDRARSMVLSGNAEPSPRSRIREVAVLGSAIDRIGVRLRRDAARRERLDDDLRRLSHELRTPLTTIRLRLEDLAGDADVDAEVDADADAPDGDASAGPGGATSHTDAGLRVIAGQLDRLDRVGEQLARLRHAHVETSVVDVGAMAAGVVARLRPVAEWEHVTLDVASTGPTVVDAEPDALEDAVSNVVENAIKHSPRGTTVRTTVTGDAAAVHVEVADQGPGIAEGLREAVLHPGVRVVGSQVERGSGQGLAIVAATLDRIGGRLELADAPGGGALVRLVIPAASH